MASSIRNVALAYAILSSADALDNGLALTPPMVSPVLLIPRDTCVSVISQICVHVTN